MNGRAPAKKVLYLLSGLVFADVQAQAFAFFSVMLSVHRSRTTADPHITAADLEACVEQWLVEQGHRDLHSLLKPLSMKVTWKTAPQPCVLSEYASLFRRFAEKCPNGVLPGQRLNLALGSSHKTRPLNYSKLPDKDFVDWASGVIRCCFSKYRDLFKNEECRRRCFCKVFFPAEAFLEIRIPKNTPYGKTSKVDRPGRPARARSIPFQSDQPVGGCEIEFVSTPSRPESRQPHVKTCCTAFFRYAMFGKCCAGYRRRPSRLRTSTAF